MTPPVQFCKGFMFMLILLRKTIYLICLILRSQSAFPTLDFGSGRKRISVASRDEVTWREILANIEWTTAN